MPLALRGKPGLGVGVLGGGGGFPRREAWEVGMKGAMKDNQIDRQSESWSISVVVSQLVVILNILGCTRIPARWRWGIAPTSTQLRGRRQACDTLGGERAPGPWWLGGW